ncbi:MAG TPA: hypothetical protein PKJ99_09720 [Thermoanaerobaculales bacterium]|nr:hypothetical protein [Thermoanaerobaculales bacterium]
MRLRRLDDFDWNLLAAYEWLVIVNLGEYETRAAPSTIHALRAIAGHSRDALFVFCEPNGRTATEEVAVLRRIGAVFKDRIDVDRPLLLLLATRAFARKDDMLEYDVVYIDDYAQHGNAENDCPDDTLLAAFDNMLQRVQDSATTSKRVDQGKVALFEILKGLWQEILQLLMSAAT